MAVEVGQIVEGTIEEIKPYGAFVKLESGEKGLIHVSEIANTYVQNVADHLQLNSKVKVKVIAKKDHNKIDLSIKQVDENAAVTKHEPSHHHNSDSEPRERVRSFEEKLSSFLKESSERNSELKRHNEMRKKKGGKRR
ncbi:MAG TPA: S1 RNA-binding domain-containing protein [Candidatus Wallbacteria bacterium]|nr:MAG: Polyribonucleotide nucleotidyltransferase [bacterium ADurb.Bin243]HOD42084.1 S1 RNA-binding domain-containing protein [Candidatus Wallbacteria bacterium]HOT74175.1 S1 RNA-binding domain-containing protein [Candidatus Wallbacteria bacterium]